MNLTKNQKAVVVFASTVLIFSALRLVPVRVEERVEIVIPRLSDEVWTVINDIENYRSFWSKAPKAKKNPKNQFEFFLLDSEDKLSDRKFIVQKYERPNMVEILIPPNFGSPFAATVWRFSLSDKDGKTTLRIEEDGTLAGWLVTGIVTSIGFNTNLKDFSRSLKNLMEPN